MRRRAKLTLKSVSMSASGFPSGEVRLGLAWALDVMVRTLRDADGELNDEHAARVLHQAAVDIKAGEDAPESTQGQ